MEQEKGEPDYLATYDPVYLDRPSSSQTEVSGDSQIDNGQIQYEVRYPIINVVV
jgi:hypothetical protein